MNREVGDNRYHENYKCDWKQKLYDREKELANKMSAAQFTDFVGEACSDGEIDSEDEKRIRADGGGIENERDMGSDDEMGIIRGI
jgi:hypothetical protein